MKSLMPLKSAPDIYSNVSLNFYPKSSIILLKVSTKQFCSLNA